MNPEGCTTLSFASQHQKSFENSQPHLVSFNPGEYYKQLKDILHLIQVKTETQYNSMHAGFSTSLCISYSYVLALLTLAMYRRK